MAKFGKILVPTDFSDVANRAVNFGVQLAETNRARLILLTVIGDLPLTAEEMMMLRVNVNSVKAYNKKQIDAATAKLKKLIRPAAAQKLRVQYMVRDGKPFAEIIHAAKDTGADLIVMASHGRGRLAELLLGSTTDRVVQKAPCSVLVVREKQRGFKMP
jgi:nucleotide-binding universal stress UspA family protein